MSAETLTSFESCCYASRRLLKAPWDTPKAELVRRLDWPVLRWRRQIASMMLFHSFLTFPPSQPISECIFLVSSSTSARRTRKPLQILLQHIRTSRYMHSFLCRSSIIWNTLPPTLRSIKDRKKFKAALTEHWTSTKFTPEKTILVQSN